MKKQVSIFLFLIFLLGCSNNPSSPNNITTNNDFNNRSKEIVLLIENKFSKLEQLSELDEHKINLYFEQMKPSTNIESKIYATMSMLVADYKTYLVSENKKIPMQSYNEDLETIKKYLDMSE